MKICSFLYNNLPFDKPRMGIQRGEEIIDTNNIAQLYYEKKGYFNYRERADHSYPSSLYSFLNISDNPISQLIELESWAKKYQTAGDYKPVLTKDINLKKPLDKIGIYRDFYVHEKHVAKGFEKRQESVPPAWYEIPVYYKGATAGFIGPNDTVLWPSYSEKLDYELELAIILGKDGTNISKENAYQYIFGYTILNDISARDIQKKEMSVRLGPSKGKDFCSIIGPVIITADEFEYKEPSLQMIARINEQEWSKGLSSDSHYTFSDMIAFASQDEWLRAGDLIGSGTVGTGCGLELDRWIKEGDTIELDIEHIGVLKNTIGPKRKK